MGGEGMKGWIMCEGCGEPLVKRLPNGLLHFKFGRIKNEDGSLSGRTPVDITIHGSAKIVCFRGRCGHVNVVNFFPNVPVKKNS